MASIGLFPRAFDAPATLPIRQTFNYGCRLKRKLLYYHRRSTATKVQSLPITAASCCSEPIAAAVLAVRS